MAASMRRLRHLTTGNCCRLFSRFSLPKFHEISLEKRLVDRLTRCNIITLTEIQKKSLQSVLNGDNVIINSETGSGKTLCYLIPILNRLLQPVPRDYGPSALVLVPNMHLGFQITELFNQLSDPGSFACPVHRDMKLHITDQYPVIVSTPQSLLQYNMKYLSTLKTVVIDEADLIIANGGRLLWQVLNNLRNTDNFENARERVQFVFVAATIPGRGEKSVLRQITTWLPDVRYISSSIVHQYVSTVQTTDVFMTEREKLANLLKYLNLSKNCLAKIGHPKDEVNSGSLMQQRKQLKVLVFVNSISKARDVFEFLNGNRTFGITAEKDNGFSVVYGAATQSDVNESSLSANESYARPGSGFLLRGKVGIFHKEVPLLERETTLERFKSGVISILVCTDLGSRGLDIADVSHVIQLDYARNAADVLHRAGRTARAGAQGTVFNFITEKDQDLVEAVKRTEKGLGAEGFSDIFSRNRMFSRRIKKKSRNK